MLSISDWNAFTTEDIDLLWESNLDNLIKSGTLSSVALSSGASVDYSPVRGALIVDQRVFDGEPSYYGSPLVDVLFRIDNNGLFVLFPGEPGTADSRTCACFVDPGGHTSAMFAECVQFSSPAIPEEYAEVKHILEEVYGYRLNVRRKANSRGQWLAERRRKLAE